MSSNLDDTLGRPPATRGIVVSLPSGVRILARLSSWIHFVFLALFGAVETVVISAKALAFNQMRALYHRPLWSLFLA